MTSKVRTKKIEKERGRKRVVIGDSYGVCIFMRKKTTEDVHEVESKIEIGCSVVSLPSSYFSQFCVADAFETRS